MDSTIPTAAMIKDSDIPRLHNMDIEWLVTRYHSKVRGLAFCLQYGYHKASRVVENDARILASVISYKRTRDAA